MKEEKKSNKMKNVLIVFLLILVGIVLWARYISTSGLKVKEYAIVNEKIPQSFNGFKIIQFSDLHFGRVVTEKTLQNLVNKINELKPQIVIFTGDLVDKDTPINDKKQELITNYLSKIDSEIAKYAIKGNHDYYNNIPYAQIMENAGFELLDNNSTFLYYNSSNPIIITGLPSSLQDFPDYKKATEILALTSEEQIKYFNLVITHEPDQIKDLGEYSIDMMIAGHSHNGQIRIPFIGAVVKSIGSKTYYEEFYQVNNTALYISSGIGVSTYNYRFLNKPSINLYRLYNN